MSNNTFAQRAFALTLGAVLALGTAPAFAYASTTQDHPSGDNSAGSNEYVDGQTKDPGWFDKNGNPIDKDGNPIDTKKGSDKGSDNGSDDKGGEVPGVKTDWEAREILESARKLWVEMYPNANVPDALFGSISSGVTFPTDEPASNIDNESELDAKKEEFRNLVKQVYPDAVFPAWLTFKNEGGPSYKHDYDIDHPERKSDSADETQGDSDNNGGEVPGVQDSSDVQPLLDRMCEIWKELYPKADAPCWLFGYVSGGVTFPAEPECGVDDDYRAYELKKEFRELLDQVYPRTELPTWLFGETSH